MINNVINFVFTIVHQMATVALYLRNVEHSPNLGVINLRFTSYRKSSYISLKVQVNKEDFQANEFPYVKKNAPHSARLNALLRSELNKAQDILFDFQIKRETLTFKAFKAQFSPKKDILFQEYALAHFKHKVNHPDDNKKITESTFRSYKYAIKCFTLFANNPYIGVIDSKTIERYKEMLLSTKSHSTAYAYLTGVHLAYIAAIEDKYPNKNAFASISLIKHNRKLQKSKTPLSLEELKSLYQDFMKFKKDRCIGNYPVPYFPVLQKFLFSCLTGLRYSDVNGLKFSHLKKIRLETGADYWYIEKVIQKTQKLRTIPLLEQAFDLIDWQADDAADRLVFVARSTDRTNAVLKAIDKMKLINKEMTTHTGRHTFGALSIKFGMRREVIQEILGHSSERMTERYAAVGNQLMKVDLETQWQSF